MTGSTMLSPTALRIERTFEASAEKVFDAWTNPDVIRRFWHAGSDWETPLIESDLRVGGRYRVTMRDPAGEDYSGSGEYTEIRRPERVAMTWTWDDPDSPETLLELDFSERDGVTTVVLTHSKLRDEASTRDHMDGWGKVLDNLERKVFA